MNMKLKTLFAAAFAVVGFCSTASAVTYPLPTDGSRLVGQNQVITIPEGNTQPLEYFAAEYQMGLSNMMEANGCGYLPAERRYCTEHSAAADPAGYRS